MLQLEDLKEHNLIFFFSPHQTEGHREEVFELVFVKEKVCQNPHCALENGPTLNSILKYAFQRRPEYFYAGKQSPSNT